VADATCAGCGCACDDIEVTVAGPVGTCRLGDAWFAARTGGRPPVATVEGRAASLDEAVDAAAAILTRARAPLVYGLGQTSCEAQRRAVGLAEAIGAVVDPAGGGAAALAYQTIGSSTATFGEIRDRAELVVVWRADPMETNPRLLERLRLERATRGPRALVVVDAQRTATAEAADAFIELDAPDDFEALWALRALVTSAPLDHDRAGALRALRAPATSAPLDHDRAGALPLDDLAERLLGARHVALIYGAVDQLGALALFSLVRDLSRDRHAVTLGLRGDGNARGAEDVLAWQTGYPAAVSFARGYPRANPGELDAVGLLERGEVDAALVIASDPLADLPAAAADRLRGLPLTVVDARASATAAAAHVAFATAADGIEVAGTVHRMDGVPVPLRAPLAAERPGVEDVLAAIAGRL
jgi:formylmethanofuran dehydrogenase subunit B